MIARQLTLPASLLVPLLINFAAALATAQEMPIVPPPPEPARQGGAAQREPARLEVHSGRPLADAPSLDQQMAERIGATLKSNRQLHLYRVEVTFHGGVAELSGHVNGQTQHDEVIRTVQGVSGVDQVVDRLEIRDVVTLRPAQGQAPPFAFPPPAAAPPGAAAPFGPQAPAAPPFPPPPGMVPRPLAPPLNGPAAPEPTPIFQPHMGPSTNMPPPRMPPNAWPTYAPYNNYSRVAYPSLYPYQSWPFVGPFYPFPKIPPGWRSIYLEWMDGCWWYGKNASSHDWWRVRYW
jgi:hypothetical protein